MGFRWHQGRRGSRYNTRPPTQASLENFTAHKDVKAYFLRMPDNEHNELLRHYRQKYGDGPAKYARKVIPEWRSGAVKMSGQIATRLVGLLPPRMPFQAKYDLVKGIWDSGSPRTNKEFWCGPDADPKDIMAHVYIYLMATAKHHTISKMMEDWFTWLASDDVKVQQQLLNHLQDAERRMIVGALAIQLPPFLERIKSEGPVANRISHKMLIGSHSVDLNFDANAKGISEQRPYPVFTSTTTAGGGFNWGWILAAVAVVVILVVIMRR